MIDALPLAATLMVLLCAAPGCGDDDSGGDGGSAFDGGSGDGGDVPTDSGQGSADARPRLAEVDLTFDGACQPRFDGRDLVVVASGESMAISTVDQPFYSLQLALEHSSGVLVLSTAQRIADGDVINVTSQGTTWTNISAQPVDPIEGSITITDYREQAGIVDLTFVDVVLENVQDQSLCTVNGRVVTLGTSF